jgi:hypothetical protein
MRKLFALLLLALSSPSWAIIDSSIIPDVNHLYFYVGERYENGIHYLDYFRPQYTFRINDQYASTVLVAEGIDGRGLVQVLVFTTVLVDCYDPKFRVIEIVQYNSQGNLMGYNNLYAQGIEQGYAQPVVKAYVCGGWED